eukprot:c589_g1_i1.p1 GENE.c589_g1_i1~~c589_g1_i1.p1  ORF type:complete len:1352 (+),score=250.27 c589_g1_i1:282-4058(+)
MADLRKAAPSVFLKMMENEIWKSILFGSGNITQALTQMASSAHSDAHLFEADCEAKLLRSLFPRLTDILTTSTSQKDIPASLLEDLKSAIDQSGRESLGNVFESAKMFEVLQDVFEISNPQVKFERVNATEMLHKTLTAVASLRRSNETQNLLELESGAQAAPPNDGDYSERTLKLRDINYDTFIRITLSTVLINSGIILALCYGLALSTLYKGIMSDSDADFVARLQMRNGESGVDDTAAVESSEFVGGNSLVVGSNSLDEMLYGADFPVQHDIPHPGQISDVQLKAALLRSDDKALYESLSAHGREEFKKLFGDEPAVTIPSDEVFGELTKPRVDKSTALHSNFGELAAFETTKSVLGDQPKKTESAVRLGPKALAKMNAHLSGFVGSLRMKILRAHLNPRIESGLTDLSSEAMQLGKVASLQDAVEILVFLFGDSTPEDSVEKILGGMVNEIRNQGDVQVCYYGGELSSELEKAKESLGASVIGPSDPKHNEICGGVKPRSETEPGSLYLKLDQYRNLQSCSEAAKLLDHSSYGMTPGAQLRLSQVNTADRIDKMYSIFSSFALVNLCLVVASNLQETFNQAFRLYKASNTDCETRDPDVMNVFWGVPMPGPACPRFGVAFFPAWLNWLVENAGSFNVLPKDEVGSEVEYACDTGLSPEPLRRTMHRDSLLSTVRLSGSLPSCTREPSSFDCAYRDTPLVTNRCASGTPGSALGLSLLPQTVGYNDGKAKMKILVKKVDTSTTSDRSSADDSRVNGFYCVSDSTFAVTPSNQYTPTQAELGTKPIDELCASRCEAGACEAFSYYRDRPTDALTCVWSPTTAPIIGVTMTEATVCYRDSGIRLGFLDSSNNPVFELRFTPNSITFNEAGATPVKLTKSNSEAGTLEANSVVSKSKWRYLEIEWTKSSVTVSSMLRESPQEANFKWSRGSTALANFPLSDSKGSTVTRMGVGCYIAGMIKDVCFVKAGATEEFLYPSETQVIAEPFSKTLTRATAAQVAQVVQLQVDQATTPEQSKSRSFFDVVGNWFSRISQNPTTAIPEALVQMEHQALEPARLLGDLFMSIRSAVQQGTPESTTFSPSDFVTKIFPENVKLQQHLRGLIDKLNLANHVFGPNAEKHRYDLEPNMFLQTEEGVGGFDPTSISAPFSSSNTADGPMAAASNLSFLYWLGALMMLAFFLAKYRDRLDPRNNVRGKFFNPLLALTPGGRFSKEFGTMSYLFLLGLLLVMLNSSSAPSSNGRFIMSEGAKAADLLVRDN